MDIENSVDAVKKDNELLVTENNKLTEDLNGHQRQIDDLEQYGRR